jgi:uncharacterized membrane protein YcaP (DUF421 family)
MAGMGDFGYYLGIDLPGAFAIVVSTVMLYFAFSVLLHWAGQRLFASPSYFDLAVVTVLGAIVGRSILGQVPTLAGGLLALGTLFSLETLAGRVRRWEGLRARMRHRAEAIWVAGRPEREVMRRHHIDDHSLWAALRAAGVHSPGGAAVVVLEQTGRFSVLGSDTPVHPAALTGVRRANEVYRRLAAAGLTETP